MAEDHAAEDFQKIDSYVMGSDNDTRTDTKTDGKSSITWSKCFLAAGRIDTVHVKNEDVMFGGRWKTHAA